MKDIFRVPKLLIKKKLKILTENEKQSLKELRQKYPLKKNPDYKEISHKIDFYDTINKDQGWKDVTEKQRLASRKPVIPLTFLKYAAIFIGVVGVGVYTLFVNKSTFSLSNTESITLQMENGDIEVISVSEEQNIVNEKGQFIGVQKGRQIQYRKENDLEELVYNELSVPYGERFELILSDNTKIHLNAGTTIKYPVKFISGMNRQVYLKGEAYFEVAKDSLHPFAVNAESIDVQVLGTKFNVSAYPEDPNINTVLVEGSVKVTSGVQEGDSHLLKPSYKASWNKESGQITTEKVDTEVYIGWTMGKLIFKNTPFSEIRKRLERHYNVTISNEDNALKSERFDATFDIETIEQVLQSFKENHETLNYTMNSETDITIY